MVYSLGPSSPTSQHTCTFNTSHITRIPVSGRKGWDLPVRRRRKGDRAECIKLTRNASSSPRMHQA